MKKKILLILCCVFLVACKSRVLEDKQVPVESGVENENENADSGKEDENAQMEQAFIFVNKNDGILKWGIRTSTDEVLVSPIYSQITPFAQGKFWLASNDNSYDVFTRSGELVDSYNDYDALFSAEKELLASMDELYAFYDEETGSFGYKKGDRIVIEPKYAIADPFIDGRAVVTTGEYLQIFSVIDEKGRILFTLEDQPIVNLGRGFFGVVEDEYYYSAYFDKMKICDSKGDTVIGDAYYDIITLEDSGFFVSDADKGFFLTSNGQLDKTKPTFEGYEFYERDGLLIKGYAKTQQDARLVYFDQQGDILWHKDWQDDFVEIEAGLYVKNVIHAMNRFNKVAYPQILLEDDEATSEAVNRRLEASVGDISMFHQEERIVQEVGYRIEYRNRMITIVESYYMYPVGAAHGSYNEVLSHYDTRSGKWITFAELWSVPGAMEALEKLANLLIDPLYLYDDGVEVPIYADVNFMLTDKGIQVIYQEYEIGPYAVGMPVVELPYLLIRDYLSEDFPNRKTLDDTMVKSGEMNDQVVQKVNLLLSQIKSDFEAVNAGATEQDAYAREPFKSLYDWMDMAKSEGFEKLFVEKVEVEAIQSYVGGYGALVWVDAILVDSESTGYETGLRLYVEFGGATEGELSKVVLLD
ncbi:MULTISPECIES: RsiV family protein [unclassified Fusibacter]|uniref:RsiV family protein n=1 Tax=unclassified Fusibacter TaxID=2624464 RepID=UPI0010130689|nr:MULTISPECIES: RsiV family protein [unclassified Fusibacter]MCK8058740.1 RsiV family protein [Fusibacter sp. A2]NPE21814.1 DUF3298 domain-containing protein [Fusibacter sp. A1]RXV61386.1 DUF3298 domain-containing protein [Fusibacter sp. A1]